MHPPPSSSLPSDPFRLELSPSRWELRALLLVAVLALLAVWLCGLPGPVRLALAAGVCGWSAWCAQRLRRGRVLTLLLPWSPQLPAQIDGVPVGELRIAWRGPLAALGWRQGRRMHWRLLWPDTLPPPVRRELRLAAQARGVSRKRRPVAP